MGRLFWVFQGRTYTYERGGSYVWSPQKNSAGGTNKGYTTMTMIKQGDIIIHCSMGYIMALSVAKTDCYGAFQPMELRRAQKDITWNLEGYKIDLDYHDLKRKMYITDEDRVWTTKHYDSISPFQVTGRSKQSYMNCINNEQAKYFLNKIVMNKNERSDVIDLAKLALQIVE